MGRFFKYSWFNSLMLRIRWRWKSLNINCKFECSVEMWKLNSIRGAVAIILFCGKCVMVNLQLYLLSESHIECWPLVSNVKNLDTISGIIAIFCIKLLVTLKFASSWRWFGGFLRVFQFPAPKTLTATMQRKYCRKWC